MLTYSNSPPTNKTNSSSPVNLKKEAYYKSLDIMDIGKKSGEMYEI